MIELFPAPVRPTMPTFSPPARDIEIPWQEKYTFQKKEGKVSDPYTLKHWRKLRSVLHDNIVELDTSFCRPGCSWLIDWRFIRSFLFHGSGIMYNSFDGVHIILHFCIVTDKPPETRKK